MTPLGIAVAFPVALAASAAVRLTWKVRTASAFVAGGAAGVVVVMDPTLWVVAVVAISALAIGACFALRTGGYRRDDGWPTFWLARLGASWLVLSFPAVVVWGSVQVAQWMLSRV